jgi:hypothetical protein
MKKKITVEVEIVIDDKDPMQCGECQFRDPYTKVQPETCLLYGQEKLGERRCCLCLINNS